LDILNNHSGTAHNKRQVSFYGGGNLYDDMQVHVMTMTMDDENNRAESTIIQMDSMEEDEVILNCNVCDYECGSDTLMMLHNNDHHRERRPFNCTDCSYTA
jgi:hypothetical protein